MTEPTKIAVARPGALELEVVQQGACAASTANHAPCMAITTTRASSLQLAPRHICDDGRAFKAKAAVIEMIAEARGLGFEGTVSAHFPPGTYGAHFVDEQGRLVPQRNPRPQHGPR